MAITPKTRNRDSLRVLQSQACPEKQQSATNGAGKTQPGFCPSPPSIPLSPVYTSSLLHSLCMGTGTQLSVITLQCLYISRKQAMHGFPSTWGCTRLTVRAKRLYEVSRCVACFTHPGDTGGVSYIWLIFPPLVCIHALILLLLL